MWFDKHTQSFHLNDKFFKVTMPFIGNPYRSRILLPAFRFVPLGHVEQINFLLAEMIFVCFVCLNHINVPVQHMQAI